MRKPKSRVVWLDRGWQPVYIGFCPTEKAWHREMKKMGTAEPYPTSSGNCSTFTNASGQDCIIVSIHERLGPDSCRHGIAGLIVHESMHAWRGVVEIIGERSPSSEFEAYSMQAISQSVMTAFCDTRFELFSKK